MDTVAPNQTPVIPSPSAPNPTKSVSLSLVIALLGFAVAGSLVAGYLLGKNQAVPPVSVVQPTAIPIPPTDTPVPTVISPAPSSTSATQPTPTASRAKLLTYALPQNWQTIRDATGTFEVGYDPKMSQVFASETPYQGNSVNDLAIHLAGVWESNPARKTGHNIDVTLAPYNGGSRHAFILGNPAEWEKLAGYHETEYRYNGWSCLVLYKIALSQSNTTNGMCAVNSTQAFRFGFGTWTDEQAETLIRTIRLLK